LRKTSPDANLRDIAGALNSARDAEDTSTRIDRVSAYFLGRPYVQEPLGGGANQKEKLSADTRGFDCVTYVETVLALANASDSETFVRNLRRLRYANSRIDWRHRNHYMTSWAKKNQQTGFLLNVTRGAGSRARRRRLSVVSGIPARTVSLRYFPKRWLVNHMNLLQSGDIVMFASTRKNLDVFHLGFIVKKNGATVLRHASRTAGGTIDQDLLDFLRRHRMSGVIVLRPS